MRHAVVRFGALLAAAIAAGCYLYQPDITLDSRIKADPKDYICGATSAHPLATLEESTPWVKANVKTCLAALQDQKRELKGADADFKNLSPIVLVPRETSKIPGTREALLSQELTDLGIPEAEFFRDDDQLLSSIAYAEFAQDQYMAAKRQGGAITPALASVLAPIGGTALALGALGISPIAVTSLGAAAGTIVGGASVIQNKDREKIYVTGAEGVQCMLSNQQPFTYVDREKLRELSALLQELEFYQSQAGMLSARVQAEDQPPECPNPKTDPKVKNRGKLLAAAEKALAAGVKTDDIVSTFLRTAHDSPATIVQTVDKINDRVSESIVGTEPSVQDLAGKLQTTIETEEKTIKKSIDEITSAKSSTSTAQDEIPAPKAKATTAAARAKLNIKAGEEAVATTTKPAGAEASKTTNLPPPFPDTSPAAFDTVDGQLSATLVNITATSQKILDIVGSNTKPPSNDACPTLAKKSGQPPAALTLVPSGTVSLTKGEKSDVTVISAQNPHVIPMFGQDNPTVFASLKEKDVLEITAAKDAESGEYPFVVIGDGGMGQPIIAVIPYVKNACKDTAGGGGQHHGAGKPTLTPKATPTPAATSERGTTSNDAGAAEQPSAAPSPQASAENDSQPADMFASKENGSIDYSNPYGY